MQSEKKPRRHRSSILKPPKARNPLSDLDFEQNCQDDDGPTASEKNKRVSFSSKKGVALFTMNDQGGTVWHDFYELPNKTDATESGDDSFVEKLRSIEREEIVVERTTSAIVSPDDDDRCVDIAAVIGGLVDRDDATNPSMCDHTEALINYKIDLPAERQETSNENSGGECDMSITQTLQAPVQIVSVEKTKRKSTSAFVYKRNADKENVLAFDHTDDFNLENYFDCRKTSPEGDDPEDEDGSLTNALSRMINEIEENKPQNGKRDSSMMASENDKTGTKTILSDISRMIHDLEDRRETKPITNACKQVSHNDPYVMLKSSIVMSENYNNKEPNLEKSIGDNMSFTCMTNFRPKHEKSLHNETKGKTIIFDNDNFDGNMSMTCALSKSTVSNNKNFDFEKSQKEEYNISGKQSSGDIDHRTDRRKTVVFDQNDVNADMSMTCIMPKFQMVETEKQLPIKENHLMDRRRTVIFQKDDANADMSMTCILPKHQTIETEKQPSVEENHGIDRRRTVVFDQNDPNANMSITCVPPKSQTIETEKPSIEQNRRTDRRTVVFGQNDPNADMSMTCVLPKLQTIETEKQLLTEENHRTERRRTIVFGQNDANADMSMTCIVPKTHLMESEKRFSNSNGHKLDRRKTIVFDQNDMNAEMSITCIVTEPQTVETKKHELFIDKDNINVDRRKTIIFDKEDMDGNMSITRVASSTHSENKDQNNASNKNIVNNNKTSSNENISTADALFNNLLAGIKVNNSFFKSDSEHLNNVVPQKDLMEFNRNNVDPCSHHRMHNSDSVKLNEVNCTTFNGIIQNSNKEKRKTIIFDKNDVNADMSITCLKSNIQFEEPGKNEFSQFPNTKCDGDKRKTIVLNSTDTKTDMSLTCINRVEVDENNGKLNFTKTSENNSNFNLTKRNTVVYNKDDENADMSMTCFTSNLKQFDKNTNLNHSLDREIEKTKTIVFDMDNTKSNMSMTCVNSKIDHTVMNERVLDLNRKNDTDNKNFNSLKRNTIVFGKDDANADMSITCFTSNLPQKDNILHFHKEKSILINDKDVKSVSMTHTSHDVDCPVKNESIKGNVFNKLEIDSNMSTTSVTPVEQTKKTDENDFIVQNNLTISNDKDNDEIKVGKENDLTPKNNMISSRINDDLLLHKKSNENVDIQSSPTEVNDTHEEEHAKDTSVTCEKPNISCIKVNENINSFKDTILHSNNANFVEDDMKMVVDDDDMSLSLINVSSSTKFLKASDDILNFDEENIQIEKKHITPQNSFVEKNNICNNTPMVPIISTHSKSKENLNMFDDVEMNDVSHTSETGVQLGLLQVDQNIGINTSQVKTTDTINCEINLKSVNVTKCEQMTSMKNIDDFISDIKIDLKGEAESNFKKTNNSFENKKVINVQSKNEDLLNEISKETPEIQCEDLKVQNNLMQTEDMNDQLVKNLSYKNDNRSDSFTIGNVQHSNIEILKIEPTNQVDQNVDMENVNDELNMSIDSSIHEVLKVDSEKHKEDKIESPNKIDYHDVFVNNENNDNSYKLVNENKRKFMKDKQEFISKLESLSSPLSKKSKQENNDCNIQDGNISSDCLEDLNLELNLEGKRKSQESSDLEKYIAVKRSCLNTSVECLTIKEHSELTHKLNISNEPSDNDKKNSLLQDISIKDSSENKVLDNITDISLVNTTSNESEIEKSDNINNSTSIKTEIDSSDNIASVDNSLKNQTDNSDTSSLQMIHESMKLISDMNKYHFEIECIDEKTWSFLLFGRKIKLLIDFDDFSGSKLNVKTRLRDISMTILNYEHRKTEVSLACLAILNRADLKRLKSEYIYCEDVPNILKHCVDLSISARKWIVSLEILYLKYGFKYDKTTKRFTFSIPNARLRCIWDINIKSTNIPCASLEDIQIDAVIGRSLISRSDFEIVIRTVDNDWNYMKNLADGLFNFIREIAG